VAAVDRQLDLLEEEERSVEEDKASPGQVEERSLGEEQSRQRARDCQEVEGSSRHQVEVQRIQLTLAALAEDKADLAAEHRQLVVHQVEERTLAGLELDREEEGTDRVVEGHIGPVELRVDRAVEVHIGPEELLVVRAVVAYIVLDPAKQLVDRVVAVRIELGLAVGLGLEAYIALDPALVGRVVVARTALGQVK
jgi:hypothetical protein